MFQLHDARLHAAEAVFQDVVDLPPAEQSALIRERCAGDRELIALVERLVEHDRAQGRLDSDLRVRPTPEFRPAPVSSLRIGRYEIVREIGHGGMGVVYEARQQSPQRAVALKVLRAPFLTRESLQRFRYEADILGLLRHPGIAQVYEAGVAEVSGVIAAQQQVPFLAMELVQGESLTAHARSRDLNVRERLELFALVCDAVQHAHQNGVIHRDLKPGNVLVDETGQPKVLDFGVARAVGADRVATSLQTSAGQVFGTLPYMSPEHVSGKPGHIDARSDVYSLGAVLFELLTGRLPVEIDERSLADAVQRIAAQQPPRLSELDRRLDHDVETIVAKSLCKDKERRYQTAADLARDVRRYLGGEAIEARRDSAGYVLRKTLWRYRAPVSAAALLMFVVAGFGVASFVQSQRNRRLATELADALTISNLERARQYASDATLLPAEDLIWTEYLRNPDSRRGYWALWEAYYLNPCLVTFVGHTSFSTGTAFSPDSAHLATLGGDGMLRTFDLTTFQQTGTTASDARCDRRLSIAYSPPGAPPRVAAGGIDGSIYVWDATNLKLERVLRGHQGVVQAVLFDPDGVHLVSGGADGIVKRWELSSDSCVQSWPAHAATVSCLTFGPQRLLATGCEDGTIRLWPDGAHQPSMTLQAHADWVSSLVFSANGELLASGSRDMLVKLWDVARGECVTTFPATNGPIHALTFENSGQGLIVAGRTRVDRWDLATATRSPLIRQTASGPFSPDGRLVVLGPTTALTGEIRVAELSKSRGQICLGGRRNRGCLAVSPDGRLVACGREDNFVQVWDLASGQRVAQFACKTGRWSSAHFDPSGRLLATCGVDRTLRLWDLATGECIRKIDAVGVVTGQPLAFHPHGDRLAVVRSDGRVEVTSIRTGSPEATLAPLGEETLSVRFSPDGRTLAVAGRTSGFTSPGNYLRLWSWADGHVTKLDLDHTPWMMDFSGDGQRLAMGCWWHVIDVLDVSTQRIQTTFEWAAGSYWSVAFRPSDPHVLASGSADGKVRLWHLREGGEVLALDVFDGFDALSVAFTPDGRMLVASGFDGSLRVWDLEYYDRHIAGNLEFHLRRHGRNLNPATTQALRGWAADALRRPWPRMAHWEHYQPDRP